MARLGVKQSNFSDALPHQLPSVKGLVEPPEEDEGPALHLGCFETLTAQPARKRSRPSSNAIQEEESPAKRREIVEMGTGGTGSEKNTGAEMDMAQLKLPDECQQGEPPLSTDCERPSKAPLSKEQLEQIARREREYFKPYIGQPVGPDNRFLVEAPLGRGSFSSVYRCSDNKGRGKEYAVKFIRDNPGLRKATEAEVRMMRRIRTKAVEKDSEGANCLLGLASVETFMHQGHLALIFHLQRYDLRSALRRLGGRGLPLQDLERYASDLFMALRALRAIRIIHTDIKPDNLLMSLDKKNVKLSDFGCAVDMQDEVKIKHIRRAYACSYRAPEIILGQSYSTRADIWSAGSTLFELADGGVLFAEDSNNKMLYDMLKTCGPFKKAMATEGKNAMKHFNSKGDFKRQRVDDSNEQLLPMRRFAKPLTPLLGRLQQKLQDVKLNDFAHLLKGCLVPEPSDRLAPEDALQHHFLRTSE